MLSCLRIFQQVTLYWVISLAIIGGLLAASLVLVLKEQNSASECGDNLNPLTLPNRVLPSRYRLRMMTVIHDSFSGSVDIYVDVVTSTRCIVMNALDLNITSVAFKSMANITQEIPSTFV